MPAHGSGPLISQTGWNGAIFLSCLVLKRSAAQRSAAQLHPCGCCAQVRVIKQPDLSWELTCTSCSLQGTSTEQRFAEVELQLRRCCSRLCCPTNQLYAVQFGPSAQVDLTNVTIRCSQLTDMPDLIPSVPSDPLGFHQPAIQVITVLMQTPGPRLAH